MHQPQKIRGDIHKAIEISPKDVPDKFASHFAKKVKDIVDIAVQDKGIYNGHTKLIITWIGPRDHSSYVDLLVWLERVKNKTMQ